MLDERQITNDARFFGAHHRSSRLRRIGRADIQAKREAIASFGPTIVDGIHQRPQQMDTEAADRSGDMFRVQRLLDIAQQSVGRSPDELMLAVIDGVESFSAGTVQADDITCLAIRRKR